MVSAPRRIFSSVTSSRPQVGFVFQGGANDTPFHWGVVHELFPWMHAQGIGLAGMSGTSGGACHAVVVADAWMKATPEERCDAVDHALERMWWNVARDAQSARTLLSPLSGWFEAVQRWQQPAFHNEMDAKHPRLPLQKAGEHYLEYLMSNLVDFKALQAPGALPVFVSTTDVRTGAVHARCGSHLSAKAVAGAGSLLSLFEPVEISGTVNADGGYSLNAPVLPLYLKVPQVTDIIVVRLTPMRQPEAPKAQDVSEWMTRRQFNSPLEVELNMLPLLAEAHGRKLNIHMISVPEDGQHSLKNMANVHNTNWGYFMQRREDGAARAKAWLALHGDAVGQRSTYHAAYHIHGQVQPAVVPAVAPVALRRV